jgi:hypothetical protein
MGEELKPCPFCGGDAKHNDGGNSTYGRFWWAVGCPECDVVLRDREVWGANSQLVLPAKECFARWNTRADAAFMEEVREVLEVAQADAVSERDRLIETEAVWTVPDEDGVQHPKMEKLPADAREELALISEKVERIDALPAKMEGK